MTLLLPDLPAGGSRQWLPEPARTGRGRWLSAKKKALTRENTGAPGGIRTPNLLIRSQMLYPLSHGCGMARTA